MTIQLATYFACAAAGLIFHCITTGKAEADRPTAIQWVIRHPGYLFGSLGLTVACCMFFMPAVLDMNANAAAFGWGLAGGSAIKNLFIKKG